MTLTDYLEANNLTPIQFARHLGCTRQAVHYWKHGQQPSERYRAKLSALGIDVPVQLLGETYVLQRASLSAGTVRILRADGTEAGCFTTRAAL